MVEIQAGDVVFFAPDEKHWHGAGPDTFMVHIAITPAISTEGGTDWLEPVADEITRDRRSRSCPPVAGRFRRWRR